jgi:hypothetical protein
MNEGRKQFFFAKKNQKTFAPVGVGQAKTPKEQKSFAAGVALDLFFKKAASF